LVNRSYVEPGGRSGGWGSNQEHIVHRVKAGETMNLIANRYGVTVAEVKRWNGLRSSKVRAGMRLALHVDNGGVPLSSDEETQASIDSSSTRNKKVTQTATQTATTQATGNQTFTHYKVKPGDTFSSISQRYPGVSVKDLMEINNMNNSKLRVGQIIKIPTV